jgi:RNA polymerase sigma factor (sigma-70 family)
VYVHEGDVGTLVRFAAKGDAGAWEAIVERFSDVVWSVARGHGLSPADAADVSQTTWLRLAEHLDRLREPERIGAWLLTTARREAIRVSQQKRRLVPVVPMESLVEARARRATEPEPGEDAGAERGAALWRAWERLSGPCKELLRALMANPAPSYQDVSRAFDMPIGSIGPTRARCLERLRTCVGVAGRPERAALVHHQTAGRRAS